jgi:hypothetical protein
MNVSNYHPQYEKNYLCSVFSARTLSLSRKAYSLQVASSDRTNTLIILYTFNRF